VIPVPSPPALHSRAATQNEGERPAGVIEVGLVERGLLDVGGVLVEDAEEFLGKGLVNLIVAADEEAVRAELIGLAQGHAGVDAVAAGLVVAGGGHSPLVGQAADDDGLPMSAG
jgi:hypothetical protein